MRFDTPVFFQQYKDEYDEKTGDYIKQEPIETKVYANVTDAKTDTLLLVYGKIKQGSKVVRLQNHYESSFDSMRIGNSIYSVEYSRKLRNKHIFVVSEVQHGNKD